MKKLLQLLLPLLAISLLLSSCKKNDEHLQSTSPSESSAESTTTAEETTTLSPQRAEGVAMEIEKGRFESFDKYSDNEKELIKNAVEEDGYTLEYNDDGTATLSNEEGSWFIGTGWADNEYTKDLPKPDFGTVTMSAEDSEKGNDFYIFLIRSATAQQVADYVDKLEESGFKPTQETVVDVKNNVISFYGTNPGGKSVEIGFTTNGLTIKIYK